MQNAVSDKYEVYSILGKGGMGSVFRGRHLQLRKDVAIKFLDGNYDLAQVKRFDLEARAAAQLRHPNLVSVTDFGTTPSGTPYIVMDLVDGVTLADLLKYSGRLSWRRAVKFFIQMCNAIEHAHERNIVHRDLKPGNIVVTNCGEENESIKIVDFGLAKIITDDQNRITQTGEVFGTPDYMSPEQCNGGTIDFRSDIYSLGCVMFECLSGATPYGADSAFSIIYKHINANVEDLHVEHPDVPKELEAIVLRCLQKDPDGRFHSASELRNALRKLAGTQAATSPIALTFKGAQNGGERKRHFPLLLSLVAVVAALSSFAAGFVLGQSSTRRPEADEYPTAKIERQMQRAGECITERKYEEAIRIVHNCSSLAKWYLGENDQRLASLLGIEAYYNVYASNNAEAERLFLEAESIFTTCGAEANPSETFADRELEFGNLLFSEKRYTEAQARFETAIHIYKRLKVDEDRSTAKFAVRRLNVIIGLLKSA